MKIREVSKDLSYQVFDLCNELKLVKREFEISNQLKRSSSSVAANIEEAQGAESKKDFIHKLRVSRKECLESIYWLQLVKDKIEIKEDISPLINEYKKLGFMIWRITVNSK
jgi:four helix bundle protein